MEFKDHWEPSAAQRYLNPLQEYRETILRLFPTLEGRVLDNCSIFGVDALFLGYFLEHYPREVATLEVGTFVGASAFCLASYPKVSQVVSVDPNPVVADELVANSDVWAGRIDFEPLKGLQVLDVARAALGEYPDKRKKVEFREGVVGSTRLGAKLEPDENVETVEVPEFDGGGESLLVLVDGLHTREGVREDLAAIFEKNPYAVAFLDDCRHVWGPFVQAGVVDFMEGKREEYRFRLVGDLGPALASSNFGVLYPASRTQEIGKILGEVGREFSERLDPLRLLERETDLIITVNRVNQELEQARKEESGLQKENEKMDQELQQARPQLKQISQIQDQNSRLRQQNENLKAHNENLKAHSANLEGHYASKRYRLADTLAETSLQVPVIKKWLRKNNE